MAMKKVSSGSGVMGLVDSVRRLSDNQVLIGVPSSESPRQGKANNATIAAVHELGAGVPKRAFLVPTIEKNADKYTQQLADDVKKLIASGGDVSMAYEKLGITASDDVKDYIVSGEFVALSRQTIDRKGSSKPLVDTGEMRNSISYEVRKNT